MSQIQSNVGKERKEIIVKKVANLFAILYLYEESPTLLDRLTNALSKEIVAKVIYDAQRVVQIGLMNNEITTSKEKIDDREFSIINVKRTENGKTTSYKVNGLLPNDKDMEDFLNLVENDIYYARRAGALAMSIVNNVLSRQGGQS